MKLYFRNLLIVILVPFMGLTNAQVIPTNRIVDWSGAGLNGTKPTYQKMIFLSDFGVDSTGLISCDQAMNLAIQSANNQSARIILGQGTFLFKKPISLIDSILIQGDGYQNTSLIFDLDPNLEQDAFQIYGEWTNQTFNIQNDINLNDSIFIAQSDFNSNDFLYIQFNDSSLVNNSWARGHVGQLCNVKDKNNDTICIEGRFRREFLISNHSTARKIKPIEWCGIVCLSIERTDTALGTSANIGFQYARNCFVESVNSHYCNFGHVRSDVSAQIEISDSYFQEANDYGGGGKGYGVVFMSGSGACKAENNIFRKLRHSMLLQSGANGNVYAYNYSIDPFWTGTSFPSNSSGDLVCHGNYPFANLFEGNVAQNLVIDDSHKDNGPFNTFFRNRLETYGIFMNNNPASDSQNFIGNEITASIPFLGYILNGSNHYTYGNNVKGTCTPVGTENIAIESMYLMPTADFLKSKNLPLIGYPKDYKMNQIPAQERYLSGQLIEGCGITTFLNNNLTNIQNFNIFPNPTHGPLNIIFSDAANSYSIEINSINGTPLLQQNMKGNGAIDLSGLSSGIYIIKITDIKIRTTVSQLIIKSI